MQAVQAFVQHILWGPCIGDGDACLYTLVVVTFARVSQRPWLTPHLPARPSAKSSVPTVVTASGAAARAGRGCGVGPNDLTLDHLTEGIVSFQLMCESHTV